MVEEQLLVQPGGQGWSMLVISASAPTTPSMAAVALVPRVAASCTNLMKLTMLAKLPPAPAQPSLRATLGPTQAMRVLPLLPMLVVQGWVEGGVGWCAASAPEITTGPPLSPRRMMRSSVPSVAARPLGRAATGRQLRPLSAVKASAGAPVEMLTPTTKALTSVTVGCATVTTPPCGSRGTQPFSAHEAPCEEEKKTG